MKYCCAYNATIKKVKIARKQSVFFQSFSTKPTFSPRSTDFRKITYIFEFWQVNQSF